ncbi:MAG: hypothetical protein U0835_03225 [Isosphaeraceae bacterium]
MNSRQDRRRARLVFEPLEGRVALSGVGGIDDGPNHNRRDAAEVRRADDAPGHHAAGHNLAHHAAKAGAPGHHAVGHNLARHGGRNDRPGHR